MQEKSQNIDEILKVKVDSTSASRVLRLCQTRITKYGTNMKYEPIFITTPNPEQIMIAQRDLAFRKILNQSDIRIPDAIGVIQAIKFMQLPAPKNLPLRVPITFLQGFIVGLATFFNKSWLTAEQDVVKGRELFIEMVKLANRKRWRVAFIGDASSAQNAETFLLRSYKRVKILSLSGPILNNDGIPINGDEKSKEQGVVNKINLFRPHFLFIGFGAPKQEKWVYRLKHKLNTEVVMVFGGTFDYISGKRKRVPNVISKLGLEWLWRLLTGNQNVSRVLQAFPIFPLKVYFDKLKVS